ncbi:MAG: hypothetical protein GY822_07090 [Deltaproteobacteria bacterium]|nr:hypothetical protein [Deltaproteobacteria bacterium]
MHRSSKGAVVSELSSDEPNEKPENDPSPYTSVFQRNRLHDFSPAAARMVRKRPNLVRFLERKPSLNILARLPLDNEERVARCLRLLRQRVFVYTSFQESVGGSPLEAAQLWSALADAAILSADRAVMHQLKKRFQPPLHRGEEVGRIVFALGKWGSEELNASSDIDVLFAYAEDDVEFVAGDIRKEPDSAHDFFRRWAQGIRSLLHDVTDDGFVFRVDLDLRPEGTRGPLVNSVDALERYYERFGLTWERAALTRLRPVVDEGAAGAELVRRLRPFISPRSAHPRVFEDLDDMRDRIETAAASVEPDYDVKRGHGGIRDVEFLVHAYQLLLAGRQEELRHGSIVVLLSQLEMAGYLSRDDGILLQEGYRFLRRTEHALQYLADQQTQLLPADHDKRTRIACNLFPDEHSFVDGQDALGTFDFFLATHRDAIRDVYERHVRSAAGPHKELSEERTWQMQPQAVRLLFRESDEDTRKRAFAELGFRLPHQANKNLSNLEGRSSSPFSPRGQAEIPHGARLAAFLLSEISNTVDPDASLGRLVDLFSSRVHHSLVGRLAESPRLARVICQVLGISTPLSKLLCRRTGMEATLFNGIKRDRLPKSRLLASLRSGMSIGDEDADPSIREEDALARMRKVQGRVLLSEGMGLFAGLHNVVQTGHHLSLLADALLERAYEIALGRIIRRFGKPQDVRFVVFALGSLGGREFGFFRDLDLLFVYDGEDDSDGKRSISCSHWAAKLAQQIIWSLSVPLAEGACYEVDARLRPSGNQGPLCVKRNAFIRYHQGASAIWERQSMLRLRPVAGDLRFGSEVKKAAMPYFSASEDDLGPQLLQMRARMVTDRAAGSTRSIKMGWGGMVDIEFVGQGLQLRHQNAFPKLRVTSTRRAMHRLASLGLLAKEQAETLREHYDALTATREVAVLVENTRMGNLSASDSRWPYLLQSRLLEEHLDTHDPERAFTSLDERMNDVRARTKSILETL